MTFYIQSEDGLKNGVFNGYELPPEKELVKIFGHNVLVVGIRENIIHKCYTIK